MIPLNIIIKTLTESQTTPHRKCSLQKYSIIIPAYIQTITKKRNILKHFKTNKPGVCQLFIEQLSLQQTTLLSLLWENYKINLKRMKLEKVSVGVNSNHNFAESMKRRHAPDSGISNNKQVSTNYNIMYGTQTRSVEKQREGCISRALATVFYTKHLH